MRGIAHATRRVERQHRLAKRSTDAVRDAEWTLRDRIWALQTELPEDSPVRAFLAAIGSQLQTGAGERDSGEVNRRNAMGALTLLVSP